MNPDGSWCQELAYTCEGGRMYNQLIGVSVALSDTEPGDGGFASFPGRTSRCFRARKKF